ncbi:ribonuclease E/G-like protein, chloroplastic isoform X2 [Ipomoea triloba]|uniref:ribonuclease E/G-like protein, chloroplastic isoform X2 n=1 Tax=Ipomoea triloba TaxID=35885 RepID=UPI00125D7334|nr:ribonuclease E/G-like protein, chloroplastic isoform X2 [Ipomoea triloba]
MIMDAGMFRCESALKGDMFTSSDALRKAGPEFSIMGHFPFKQGKSFALSGSHARRPFGGVFRSWMVERCAPLHLFIPRPVRDEHKAVKCFKNDSSVLNHILNDLLVEDKFFPEETDIGSDKFLSEEGDVNSDHSKSLPKRDHIVEEPWLLQPSLLSHHFEESDASGVVFDDNEYFKCLDNDDLDTRFLNHESADGESEIEYLAEVATTDKNSGFSGTCYGSSFPVEEPWLFESTINYSSCNDKMIPDVSTCEEHARSEEAYHTNHSEHHQEPEKLLPVENIVISEKESVTTVILINSSICTMQRIAVLENGRLVELLLEPVKNNVQCDSVYLGVVTKLAPQMNGAFVNIGCRQTAFMNIISKKKPFVFPQDCDDSKGSETNGFESDKFAEKSDLPETEANLNEAIEDDEIDDDSVEYIDNDFEENENHDRIDASEVLEGNGTCNVGNGVETHLLKSLNKFEKNGHQEENKRPKGESKWAQVRKGTKIIVQVVKEGLGTKGPALTAYPKLRSRFWVLSASSDIIGISKKISGVERTRLRVIARTLQPPGFGLTVRTVAAGHSLEELKKDLDSLLLTWKSITEHAQFAALAAEEGVDGAVPVMLHQAKGQTLCIVQDYFNDKVKSMVVDSPRTYHEVKNYLQEIAPDLCDRVELYNNKTPLFDEYNIEGEIDSILSKRVPLSNGGYLVIEQTEALFSIDVNGGQCMLGQGTSQEKAILDVNLAAARQIARELRLRDIGGIIVVDFIDMMDDSNKRLVYEEVKKAVERDRSTVHVSEVSRNGLMEITRKRVRPSVTFMISEPCTCCHGTGRVEALETAFSKIEREVSRFLSRMDQKSDPRDPNSWPRFILMVDQYMSDYLTKGKKSKLAVLSSSLKVWIVLKVARNFTRGAFDLKPLTIDEYNNQDRPPIPVLWPAEAGTGSHPHKKVTLFPIKKSKTGGK